jgi:SAM-dependent methyltransferase
MIDLGETPLANHFLREEELTHDESRYPLRVVVCDECLLAQLDETADPREIFAEYAYFSSYSESWLEHARRYTNDVIRRFNLTRRSQVVEIASNDGYLLKNFVEKEIPALGIEPAANVGAVAAQAGIPTRVTFFTMDTARELVSDGIRADLMVANNVLAHVPEPNDFVEGFRTLLKPDGVATFEFAHLLRLIDGGQFDTIYHEHYSYFSLLAVERLFARHGLTIFDVQELPTHGGSLRLFVQHAGGPHRDSGALSALRSREEAAGLRCPETYRRFGETVVRVKTDLVEFFRRAKTEGKRVVGYGAPAKANTLLNYCGVGPDLLSATVDRNPHKQQRYLPGSHIPVLPTAVLRELRPDYVLILPWNLREEIARQLCWIGAWGGQFVIPIPELSVFCAAVGIG